MSSEIAEKGKIKDYFDDYFEAEDYSADEVKVLANASDILNDIYNEWIKNDNISTKVDVGIAVKGAIES